MCGIVGILARNAAVVPEILERATESLSHRGPDDSGTIIIRDSGSGPVEIGLGNRRLAILDLSPLGHQPMQDPGNGNWIVYNGEIYNFREVRKKLRDLGVTFQSDSDTEVLLKAYGRWGVECLQELRGMFAFAIWDASRHRLFLARDPMGIKPLYFGSFGQHFLFASEIRTLLGTRLVPRLLDPAGLLNFLEFGSLYDPITLIQDVSALQAGHFLVWENGAVQETRYWDLVRKHDPGLAVSQINHNPAQRSQLEEDLCHTIDESVRMQMVSDVPVGVFLSGGIDSSSLVGILRRSGLQLSTFSIVFREADYSEAEYSRLVAGRFGTDHHEILCSQHDALEALPGAIRSMDQPTIDGLNTYFVSRQTRAAGIKVALSGLGGDEMFAGYSSFRTVPRMERVAGYWRHTPKFLKKLLANAYTSVVPDTDQSRKLVALARDQGRLLHPYFLARMLFTPEQSNSLSTVRDSKAIERSLVSSAENLADTRNLDPVNRVSYLESRCYMLNTLLRDSDVMSMAHGLEVRVPLIDHHLAEKLFVLPGNWKLDAHTPKPLLVAALYGDLPDQIVHRRKRGFTLPFEHWLRDDLHSGVDTTLRRVADGPLASVLDTSSILEIWQDFHQGRTSWSRPWALYVLQRWCELHSVTA
jgi:asparagine synthase (glutamine-hydrolysing)